MTIKEQITSLEEMIAVLKAAGQDTSTAEAELLILECKRWD